MKIVTAEEFKTLPAGTAFKYCDFVNRDVHYKDNTDQLRGVPYAQYDVGIIEVLEKADIEALIATLQKALAVAQ